MSPAPYDALSALIELKEAYRQLDEARRWAAAWKRAAKKWIRAREHSAECARTFADQRDEARAYARHYYLKDRRAMSYRERVEEISFQWVDRAKKAERERDEARAEVERLRAAISEIRKTTLYSAVQSAEKYKAAHEEARRMYRALENEIFDMFQNVTPTDWAYVDSTQALFAIEWHLERERDEARAYAGGYAARCGTLKSQLNAVTQERDALKADNERLHDALANASAAEVDAVKTHQVCERELHDTRVTLEAERQLRQEAQAHARDMSEKLYEAHADVERLERMLDRVS